jgi:hypothetical protein
MINEIESQIPDGSTTWHLWYLDKFDRDFPPSLEVSGEKILNGLYKLWLHTLREGLQDNGSASFSHFQLRLGSNASMRVEIYVNPFNNAALIKLRQWANLMSQNQEAQGMTITGPLEEQRIPVVNRLAQLHYELLQKSTRWNAKAIDWSAESRELLARVELITESKEL